MKDNLIAVNLRIADRPYVMRARNAEEEHYMRLAADKINQLYKELYQIHANIASQDKLAYVALRLTVAFLKADEAKTGIEGSVKQISEDLRTYLDKIENR